MLNTETIKLCASKLKSVGTGDANLLSNRIKAIVDSYTSVGNNVEETTSLHEIEGDNFVNHDTLITTEAKHLSNILGACLIKWNTDIKPRSSDILDKLSGFKLDNASNLEVNLLKVPLFIDKPNYAKMVQIGEVGAYAIQIPLATLSIGLGMVPRSDDELSTMLVNSGLETPDSIAEYLAELPSTLIRDVHEYVFVDRCNNDFLPMNFIGTGHDFIQYVKYGDHNLDKLILTTLFANYYLENVQDVGVSLDKYNTYFNTLQRCAFFEINQWLDIVLPKLTQQYVVADVTKVNGRLTANIITNNLERAMETGSVTFDQIATYAELKKDSFTVEEVTSSEVIERINTYLVENGESYQIRYDSARNDFFFTLLKDEVTSRGADIPDDVIGRYVTSGSDHSAVLNLIVECSYRGTYLEQLVKSYISQYEVNPTLDRDAYDGVALISLACKILMSGKKLA